MKAILVASMPNRNATQYLVDSGFPKKKQNRAIQRKKAENKARTRKAEKENRVPSLVEEVAKQEFRAPLKNAQAASKAQRDYNHLTQGQDLPKPVRPSNVKEVKIDFLMRWIVENCHFRPGKTRNIYFKTEKIRLKNIALYIRYGSIKANHEAYCDAVPLDLKIGHCTFRKVLSAMTLKGTYNQGLSYYWVDFVDMIQFASDMLDRLGKIVDGRRIDPNQKADIKLWLERARETASYTSEY